MFKYKSPLSRLLEGAGKSQDSEAATPEVQQDQAEPIADFNALREALAGGNMASESYEEADELIPEEKMPDFQATEETAPEVSSEQDEPAPEAEPVVALRLSDDELVQTEDEAEAAPAPVEAEPAPVAEPEIAQVQSPVEVPQPVAEAEPVQTPQAVAPAPAPASAPADDRRSRVKTTFLGFERADTHVQDLIETAEPVKKSESTEGSFPVGWLVITGGPGRGSSITLTEGLMQIGRNDDQAIQLDFGDTGISRSSHAVIAYDPEDRKCYLGHGGKANLVRLNGKPVLSTVPLSTGDLIRISETSIRFAAFCDDGFDWRDEK